MNVAIIGCGLVGNKRANLLAGCCLVACADLHFERAQMLAKKHPSCRASQDWREVVVREDVAIVIIATTHNVLAEIALAAIGAGKHVLIEKPAGRCSAELIS